MKNVYVKFRVATNSNIYYATSLKAAASFCKKHDFVITMYYSHFPTIAEKQSAVKCGRGVYCIPETNYAYLQQINMIH